MDTQLLDKAYKYATNLARSHYYKMNEYKHDPSIELDDVKQVALTAAWLAVEEFDPDRGTQLNTYVHGLVDNALATFDVQVVGVMTPRRPTSDDVYDNYQMVSIDEVRGSDEGYDDFDVTLHDLLPGDDDVEANVLGLQQAEYIEELLDKLPDDTNQYILKHTFGILGHDEKTQEELAEELGVSQQNIQQRIQTCLRQLRSFTNEDSFEDYI